MLHHRIIYIILIVVMAGGVVFSIFGYFNASTELSLVKSQLALQKHDERVTQFLSMFVKKVIKADKEISFDDRLVLENTVRSIGDKEILTQWKKFVDSKDQKEAQKNTKDLLGLLVDKVSKTK